MLETRGRRDIRAAGLVNCHPALRTQNAVPVIENGWFLIAVLAIHLFFPERYFGAGLPSSKRRTFVMRWVGRRRRPNHFLRKRGRRINHPLDLDIRLRYERHHLPTQRWNISPSHFFQQALGLSDRN